MAFRFQEEQNSNSELIEMRFAKNGVLPYCKKCPIYKMGYCPNPQYKAQGLISFMCNDRLEYERRK